MFVLEMVFIICRVERIGTRQDECVYPNFARSRVPILCRYSASSARSPSAQSRVDEIVVKDLMKK